MDIYDLITRFDDSIYDFLLGGKNVIKIVKAIDSDKSSIDLFSSVLIKLYPPNIMLDSGLIRDQIIDVLRPAEIQELARVLEIKPDANDIYDRVKNIPFNSSKYRKILFDFFNIEYTDLEEEKETIFSTQLNCGYPLFKHQRHALKNISNIFQRNNRVLLHMPTGSGKTRTAANVICNHLRVNEPTVIIWLANAEELCEQTYDEISKAWGWLGNRDITIMKFYGNSKEKITSLEDGVIIASLQKMNALLSKDSVPITTIASKTSLVIIDEAHIAVAETYKDIMNLLVEVGNSSNLLGLSATPGRTWNDRDEDLKLSRLFNKNKVVLKIDDYDNPIDYLVEEKYLAKVNNTPLYYNGANDISEYDIKNIKEHLRLSDKFIEQLSKDNIRNIAIVNKVKELINRHKRIILFAMTVEHSIVLATSLQLLGINAYSVTTKSSKKERRNTIERYKSDDPHPIILCNYGILTTGFDAPKTSCALITRPTDSLVLYSQMIGRAIRGEKAGGNKESEIVTVIDTQLPGFDSVASAFFNWEDVWT